MCGIFGWIKPNNAETDLDLTRILRKGLIETQTRGIDATGYYTLGTGIIKQSVSATQFVNKGYVLDVSNEKFVIGHCRMASSNSKEEIKEHKNAHPFESKNWILVHNGVVHMDEIKDYNYTSNVDSEVILAHIEKNGLRKTLASIKGSATLVLYSKPQKKLYFWTDGMRSLSISYYHNIVIYASTKKIIQKTLGVKNDLGLFPKISFATIHENELIEYDVTKSKFIRKGIIEKNEDKVTIKYDWYNDRFSKSYLNTFSNISSEQTSFFTPTKSLPKGCTENPNSKKIVTIKSNGTKLIKYLNNKN